MTFEPNNLWGNSSQMLTTAWFNSSKHYQALEDAFLAIDGKITTEEVIKELVQIAGRPTEETTAQKVAEEDDCECTPRRAKFII